MTSIDPSAADARSAARAALWRAHLVQTGRLTPLEARPTLRLDERGRAVARRHIEAGDYGRTMLAAPPGYFELPAWHVRALEARDRRVARFNAFLKRAWPMRSWSEVAASLKPDTPRAGLGLTPRDAAFAATPDIESFPNVGASSRARDARFLRGAPVAAAVMGEDGPRMPPATGEPRPNHRPASGRANATGIPIVTLRKLEGSKQELAPASAELGIAECAPHGALASASSWPEHAKLTNDVTCPVSNEAHALDPTTADQ